MAGFRCAEHTDGISAVSEAGARLGRNVARCRAAGGALQCGHRAIGHILFGGQLLGAGKLDLDEQQIQRYIPIITILFDLRCNFLQFNNDNQTTTTVKDVLLELRRFRLGLIQTAPQLYFSYKAIIEGIKHFNDPVRKRFVIHNLYRSITLKPL